MTEEQSKQLPSQPKSRSTKPALVLSGIALVVTIAIAGYGWTLLEKTQQQLNEVSAQASQLASQLSSAQMQASKTTAQLNQSLDQTQGELNKSSSQTREVLSRLQADTQQLHQRLNELNIHDLNQWRLYEAQYLIHIAARKAWLENDINSAKSLLHSADQSISGLKDPSYIPLRRTISDDINHLDALPEVDIEGIVIKIDSLREQIQQLALTQVELPKAQSDTDQPSPTETQGWLISLKQTWHRFIDQFITVRRREGDVEPLLAPQQSWYLKQNLQLQLQQAALAAERRQNDLYQQSLKQAIDWINRYFTHNPASEHLVRSLNELSETPVSAVKLQQLGSVAEIDHIITQLGQSTSQVQENNQ
ncbi:uroporphyrinogen-III C-methyltransferase [Celerinatantimonas sp. YJH-8]|uniref:uroporphyrinogen-III C-methyltransferase n=1 Tax=Celerinatantimonas sp. YJH-8 TaxID=3228714 RepID=UPI0038BECF2C